MTQDDDPKPIDWARVPAVTDNDVARWRTMERKAQHPSAPLLIFLPILGVVAWMFTGDWRWAVLGVLALFACAAVGASIDGAKRKRGDR